MLTKSAAADFMTLLVIYIYLNSRSNVQGLSTGARSSGSLLRAGGKPVRTDSGSPVCAFVRVSPACRAGNRTAIARTATHLGRLTSSEKLTRIASVDGAPESRFEDELGIPPPPSL